MKMFALSCRPDMNRFPAMQRRFDIPLDDCVFYATLRRGFDVSLLSPTRSFSEAVCVWPHPDANFLVLPLNLPAAEDLEQQFPEFAFAGHGLHGQWRLEKKRQNSTALTLELVRALELAEFWALVTRPNINPPWIEACFAPYFGVKLADVPGVCVEYERKKEEEEAEAEAKAKADAEAK
jgi:hypothetical protein